MGVGLVALATLLLGAAISVAMTRLGQWSVAVATLTGVVASLAISTLLLPIFPFDSPSLPGALVRLAVFITPFVLAAAASGRWLKS